MKGKPKLYRTDLVIRSFSRDWKTLSYIQINTVLRLDIYICKIVKVTEGYKKKQIMSCINMTW